MMPLLAVFAARGLATPAYQAGRCCGPSLRRLWTAPLRSPSHLHAPTPIGVPPGRGCRPPSSPATAATAVLLRRHYSRLPVPRPRPTSRPLAHKGYVYFKQHDAGPRHYPRQFVLFFGMPLIAFGLYYVWHLDTVPISGRRRFLAVSEATELRLAQSTYRQLMSTYKDQMLPANHPVSQLVRRVGSRIAQSAGMSEAFEWEFVVIDDPSVNCFVIPGGKVFLFTGILPILRDEDGMAVVLGHEVAHQKARHTGEKLSFAQVVLFVQLLVSAYTDLPLGLQSLVYKLVLELPFSRKCETEADYIGLILTAGACYNPAAAIGVWQRMEEIGPSSTKLSYVSTHPSNVDRIAEINTHMAEAERVRQERCVSRTREFWAASQRQ